MDSAPNEDGNREPENEKVLINMSETGCRTTNNGNLIAENKCPVAGSDNKSLDTIMDPDDVSRRKEEFIVLQEILCEEFSCNWSENNAYAVYHANVLLKKQIVLSISNGSNTKNKSFISHLPPIRLEINLPDDYPSKNPPRINISCIWLSKCMLDQLTSELDRLWEESKGEIIFTWYLFLKDLSIEYFNITDSYDLSKKYDLLKDDVEAEEELDQELMKIYYSLIEFNTEKLEVEFMKSSVKCILCFLVVLGKDCKKLECGHLFCSECLQQLCEVNIKNGTVSSIGCPEVNCEFDMDPNLVKELVSKDLYEQYDSAMLNRALDKMTDVTYCPQLNCQVPFILACDNDSLGVCPHCDHAFCKYCKKTFHGVEDCGVDKEENKKIVESYQNGDDHKKKELESKFGKKQITEWINDMMTAEWMRDNTKKCPSCRAHIEKNYGCNKMRCQKCNATFCWLCLERIDSNNHFSDPRLGCHARLFEGAGEDEEDEEDEEVDPDDWYDEEVMELWNDPEFRERLDEMIREE